MNAVYGLGVRGPAARGLVAVGLAVACAAGGLSAVAAQPKPQKAGHAHAHPTEGPHHGVLIELGAVPIAAKQLMLNLLVGGKPQQFRLVARPQSTDPEGTCSAFGCTSEPMCKALDAKGTTSRLNVEIAGKMFVGKPGGHSHNHAH